jgi:hypothetical protein
MAIRLYVKPKTKPHDVAAAYLRLYGILPELMKDKRDGTYFDVTPPVRWAKTRQEEFRAGLDRLDWR